MPRKAHGDSLTNERIVECALQLIDRNGLGSFSMRVLAEELQVDAKAIYYYLPSKEAVIIAAIELAFAQLRLPDVGATSWQEDVRAIAQAYLQFARAHPHLFTFLTSYNQTVPVAFEIDERLAQTLLRAGFAPTFIIQCIYTLLMFIDGCVQEQVNGVIGHGSNLDDVYKRFRELPSERYPAIHSITEQITPQDLSTDFRFMLNLLIRSAELQLEER